MRIEIGGTGGPPGCGTPDQIGADNESLEGSDGPDVLIGDEGDNSFLGHLGADTFLGRGGDDFVDAIDGAADRHDRLRRRRRGRRRPRQGRPGAHKLLSYSAPAHTDFLVDRGMARL